MGTILWHDYETGGTDPAVDRPFQFAAVRTDEDLAEVGEPLCLYCRPTLDWLPHPEACLVTGISPQRAERLGLPEPAFAAAVHEALSVPGTCGAGYNSLRFDDEVTRHLLYRNFFDPYEREWRDGNSRWDIIDMVRLVRALRPTALRWPEEDEEGGVSLRLEDLTAANGIEHGAAHDALADVRATLALARLIRQRLPGLYRYVYDHRLKQRVAPLVDPATRKPFFHVSGRLPRRNRHAALMIPLAWHPQNRNSVICFNLDRDPRPLLELDAASLRERLFAPAGEAAEERPALKEVHLNRCPVVVTPRILDEAAARALGIDLERCERHWRLLRDRDLGDKLAAVYGFPSFEGRERDVERALYDGFPPESDRALLAAVRAAAPQDLRELEGRFCDRRYRELLFRRRARHHPETLSAGEAERFRALCRRWLAEGEDGRLALADFAARLAALSAGADAREAALLAELRAWGERVARAAGLSYPPINSRGAAPGSGPPVAGGS
ncbi:MAG: exodeoxyribonuclease I [Porticoccaceae bacterium]|nr:MAG: exodeoxyribonuclease I [Porticoccaceae bacterium]